MMFVVESINSEWMKLWANFDHVFFCQFKIDFVNLKKKSMNESWGISNGKFS